MLTDIEAQSAALVACVLIISIATVLVIRMMLKARGNT